MFINAGEKDYSSLYDYYQRKRPYLNVKPKLFLEKLMRYDCSERASILDIAVLVGFNENAESERERYSMLWAS